MGKKKKILIVLIVIFAIVLSGFILYTNENNKAINHPLKASKPVRVVVKEGDSLYGVMNELKNNNQLNNIYLMKLYIKNKNIKTNKIKAGNYLFKEDITLEQFINNLTNGLFNEDAIKITIPEGYDIEHIAASFEQKGLISKEKFLLSCKEYSVPTFVKKDQNRKYLLEGYLFPDTYDFTKGMDGKEIIDIMIKRFESVINEISKDKMSKPEELDKIITMASIVEKEAEKSEEQGKVASVFYNRINKKMKLQSCATVLYSMGVHKDKLSYEDLKIKSPYNTYIVDGLPAGPICCPGKKAIKAAIEPEKTNYLYFVSNNNGTHFFTDDYNKFLEVKKKTQGD